MIFTLKLTKGHNSELTVDGVMVLVFCNFLMMLNTCTMFVKITQRLSNLNLQRRVLASLIGESLLQGVFFLRSVGTLSE